MVDVIFSLVLLAVGAELAIIAWLWRKCEQARFEADAFEERMRLLDAPEPPRVRLEQRRVPQ